MSKSMVFYMPFLVRQQSGYFDWNNKIFIRKFWNMKEARIKAIGRQASEIFKCDKCERVFTSEQAMLNHKKRHKDNSVEKRHCCTLCSYSTKYSSHLKQHIFTHTGERPFKCTRCKAGFTQNSLLKKHMLTHSPKEETKRSSPEKQQSKDTTKNAKNFSLKQRLLSYTLPTKNILKKFKCERCGKKFDDFKKLLIHLKKHKIREKPYKCSQCDKRFSELSNLKKHKKKHPEEEEEEEEEEEKDSEEISSSETTSSSSD